MQNREIDFAGEFALLSGSDNIEEKNKRRQADDRQRDDDDLANNVPRQPFELEEKSPRQRPIRFQEAEFPLSGALGCRGGFVAPFRFKLSQACAQLCHFPRLIIALVVFWILVVAMAFIHVCAVSQLVQDRFAVSPKPGQPPEQAAQKLATRDRST
jgi:hypothetical protein